MRSAGRAAATTGEPSRGAASQQRARERRARTTESRAGHDQSKVVESDGGRAHIPLSFQLDTPLCQVNATREKEPQHASEKSAQQQHLRSPRELSELARLYTGPSREVLGDDLHRHPVSRPRPFAVHEGHRVVGGRPVDEYQQRGQAARNVSPFFGRGECLSGGASGVVRPQFLTLWY